MQYRKPVVLIAIVILCLASMLMMTQSAEAQRIPSAQVNAAVQPLQETPLMDQKLANLKAIGGRAPTLPTAGTPYVSSTNWPVVLVHGFRAPTSNGSSLGFDCKAYFDPNGHGVRDYLSRTHNFYSLDMTWHGGIRSVGYYSGDTNCNDDLRPYQTYCTGYYAGSVGTNNENLAHTACELAWYIWERYTSWGQSVQIVAHSMGGLIARWALYATPVSSSLPPYLLVQDVVTLDTPHGGVPQAFSFFSCGGCTQATQMENNNAFMRTLYDHGQNPRGAGWGTDWTMMGQTCSSDVVDYRWATYMSGGHKVAYSYPCFDHGGFMRDWGPLDHNYPDASNGDTADATVYYCDGCAVEPSNWQREGKGFHSLRTILYGLYYPTW